MKRVWKNRKKLLMVLGLVLLAAALVWAAAELSGQANGLAQDAGNNSADMEMVTLNTIKKPQKTKASPTPPPCDWQKERQIKGQLDANDAQYKQLRAKAKSELSGSGKVSPATKSAVMNSAQKFNSLCEQYAAMWDACNCNTRGKTARKTGQSRVKSAAVLVSGEINEGALDDMQSAQNDMKAARREYVATATEGGELAPEDMSALNANVVPQAQQVVTQVAALVTGVTSLLNNIRSQVSAGPQGALGAVIGAAGAGQDPISALLKPVTTLLSVTQNMLGNAEALVSDSISLATGKAPAGVVPGMGKMAPCFVESLEKD